MRFLALTLALLTASPLLAGDGRGKLKDQLAKEIKGKTLRLRVEILGFVPWDARIATTASPDGVTYPNHDQPLQFAADSEVEIESLWGWDRGVRLSLKRPGYKPHLFLSGMAGIDADAKDAEMRKYMGYANLEGDTLEAFHAALGRLFYLDGAPPPAAKPIHDASSAAPPAPTSTIDLEGYGVTRWGMTREDVQGAVSGLDDVSGTLAVQGTVAGLPAIVIYRFTGAGRLSEVSIGFTTQHSNKTDHLTDFGHVKEGLTTKYGEPTQDRTVWKNDLYRDDPSHYGMAVATGHLLKAATWKLPTTEILLMLSGDNYTIKHTLYYASVALKGEGEAVAKAKAIDGL